MGLAAQTFFEVAYVKHVGAWSGWSGLVQGITLVPTWMLMSGLVASLGKLVAWP